MKVTEVKSYYPFSNQVTLTAYTPVKVEDIEPLFGPSDEIYVETNHGMEPVTNIEMSYKGDKYFVYYGEYNSVDLVKGDQLWIAE